MKYLLRPLVLITALIVLPAVSLGQDKVAVTAKKAEPLSFYTGTGYGSNMIYLGSTISQNQPYYYGAGAFSLFEKLYLSGGAFYLPALAPSAPAFWNVSVSFAQDITPWLDLTAGAYRYMVRPSLADTLFGNFNYADISVGIDWKILYTEINYGAFLLKDPPAYLQLKNSRYFETPSFLRKKASISFTPFINLMFGSLLIESTFEGTELITTTQSFVIPVTTATTTVAGAGQGSGSGSGSGNGATQGQGNGSKSGTGTTTTTTTSTTTTTTVIPVTSTSWSEKFDLVEMEFGLPVSFNLDFMSLEAEVTYVLPMYSDQSYPGPRGFVFSFSAFFKIF